MTQTLQYMISTHSASKKCKDMFRNKAFTYEECYAHKQDKAPQYTDNKAK